MKNILKSLAVVAVGLSLAGPASAALTCPTGRDLTYPTIYSLGNTFKDQGGEFVETNYLALADFNGDGGVCEIAAGNPVDVKRLAPWAGDSLMAFECGGKRLRSHNLKFQIQDSNGVWHNTVKLTYGSGPSNELRQCYNLEGGWVQVLDPRGVAEYKIAGTEKTFQFGIVDEYLYESKPQGSFGF